MADDEYSPVVNEERPPPRADIMEYKCQPTDTTIIRDNQDEDDTEEFCDERQDLDTEKEISTNTTGRNSRRSRVVPFEIGHQEIKIIRRGIVPPFTRPDYCSSRERLRLLTELLSIVNAFYKEENGESFKDARVLEALAVYVYLLLDNIYNIYLTDPHFEYFLDVCEKNISNACLIACMLSVFCKEWSWPRRHEDLDTKSREFLVHLTFYHYENHTCWASTLTEAWNIFMHREECREEFITLFCENTLFADAFMDLLQCKIEKVYMYNNDIEVNLIHRTKVDGLKYCIEMIHYVLFRITASKENEESVRVRTVASGYIPCIYSEEGEIQSCSSLVTYLTRENEYTTKSANKK
jgi:hypothetical protein